MSVLDELREILEDHELDVEVRDGELQGVHGTLPIAIVIAIDEDNNRATIELRALEDLEDVMNELVESGEDLRSIVDEVLSEIRDIAIELSRILESRGYKVSVNIREGESDVRDLMEDIIEEYEEVVGVEEE
ncbi:hypothetical protein J4526_04720 [Desulfurococcaceae archaeon MEX13E-LK6-19]|nr:hypothetical protein J4526_04720 [Desulfurococcaceae archaeon MEX13E-LK6-19]